jgi:hypothetical protein
LTNISYETNALFVWLISHQTTVFFSQNKSAITNQPAVLFSQNKAALAISHQPNEQAENQFEQSSVMSGHNRATCLSQHIIINSDYTMVTYIPKG